MEGFDYAKLMRNLGIPWHKDKDVIGHLAQGMEELNKLVEFGLSDEEIDVYLDLTEGD